jgi:hypothetical protein
MEVYYIQKPFALVGDIYGQIKIRKGKFFNLIYLVPIENIATLEASAVVSEGVSRMRNALINGDYQSYDWDSGRFKLQSIQKSSFLSFRLHMSSNWFRWNYYSIMPTTCCQFNEVNFFLNRKQSISHISCGRCECVGCALEPVG